MTVDSLDHEPAIGRIASLIMVSYWATIIILYAWSFSAAAAPAEDIPEAFADSLGISAASAQMLIGGTILIVIAMCMGILRVDTMAILIVELVLIGLFVMIDFFPDWLLILAAVIVGVIFATHAKGALHASG